MLSILGLVVCLLYGGNAVLYGVSTQKNTWDRLGDGCRPADTSLFCRNKVNKVCVPDYVYQTDISVLPDTFAAWLNAYLVKSASIIYYGCFKVSNYTHRSTKYKISDVLRCARACLSTGVVVHTYFGILGVHCYCFLEEVSTQKGMHDVSRDTNEETCSDNQQQIKVYRALIHTNLEKERCPVAYPIDTIEIFLEDCDNHNKFYCSGRDIVENNPLPWYKAQAYCQNRSATLGNKYKHNSTVQWKFWTNGLQYTEYYIKSPLPLFGTRCAALVRNNSDFYIRPYNCSSVLPTLCLLEENKTTPKTTSITFKGIVLQSTTFAYTFSRGSTEETMASKLPTEHQEGNMTTLVLPNTSTSPILFSVTVSTTKPSTETISIVLPVVGILLVVLIVLIIVIYKRRACFQGGSDSYGHTISSASEGTALTIHSSAESSAVDL